MTVKEQKSSVEIIDEKIGGKINNVNSIHRNGMTLPPVVLPRCAILKKGYQRASVICQYKTGLIDDETDQFMLFARKHHVGCIVAPRPSESTSVHFVSAAQRERIHKVQIVKEINHRIAVEI